MFYRIILTAAIVVSLAACHDKSASPASAQGQAPTPSEKDAAMKAWAESASGVHIQSIDEINRQNGSKGLK